MTHGTREAIFAVDGTVFDDGSMDVWTHPRSNVPWDDLMAAATRIRDELNRLIEQGPTQCPFRPGRKAEKRART